MDHRRRGDAQRHVHHDSGLEDALWADERNPSISKFETLGQHRSRNAVSVNARLLLEERKRRHSYGRIDIGHEPYLQHARSDSQTLVVTGHALP